MCSWVLTHYTFESIKQLNFYKMLGTSVILDITEENIMLSKTESTQLVLEEFILNMDRHKI